MDLNMNLNDFIEQKAICLIFIFGIHQKQITA